MSALRRSQAWKQLERRVCRALGGQRLGPGGHMRSDCTAAVPFAVEVKYTQRVGPPVGSAWIQQAKRNAKLEGQPWLVVVAGHYDPKPIVALDFGTFIEIARAAGILAPLLVDEPALQPEPVEIPAVDQLDLITFLDGGYA